MNEQERIDELKSRIDDLEVKLAIHSRIHSVYDDHVPTHQILESMALRLDNIEDRLAQVEKRLDGLENNQELLRRHTPGL